MVLHRHRCRPSCSAFACRPGWHVEKELCTRIKVLGLIKVHLHVKAIVQVYTYKMMQVKIFLVQRYLRVLKSSDPLSSPVKSEHGGFSSLEPGYSVSPVDEARWGP